MDRRSFLLSAGGLCSVAAVAGCLSRDEGGEDDPVGRQYREVEIPSEMFTLDREFLSEEEGVFHIEVTNRSEQPRSIEIRLQIRDGDGNPVGSEYVKQHGPIEPQNTASIEFELDADDTGLVGYKIVITETDGTDGS